MIVSYEVLLPLPGYLCWNVYLLRWRLFVEWFFNVFILNFIHISAYQMIFNWSLHQWIVIILWLRGKKIKSVEPYDSSFSVWISNLLHWQCEFWKQMRLVSRITGQTDRCVCGWNHALCSAWNWTLLSKWDYSPNQEGTQTKVV